jgi:small GTP-binding protein
MRVLFISLFILSSMSFGMENTKNVIIVGNPGTGKSALINTILKKKVSKSGLNIGTGLTCDLSLHHLNGINFIDTPGLSDISKRVHAAQQIQKALEYKASYKILFVLTVESTRLREDDINTIKTVMDAIIAPNKTFTIIINKLYPMEKKFIELNMNDFITKANKSLSPNSTSNFLMINYDGELDDDDPNSFLEIDNSLRNYVMDSNNYFYIGDLNYLDPDKKATIMKKMEDEHKAKLERIRVAEENRIAAEKARRDLDEIKRREDEERRIQKENERLADERFVEQINRAYEINQITNNCSIQ